MQTSFAEEQLADGHMAASEKILRSCVHCGFCTATCPTYLLEGDELDSPRGRIYLIKDMLEKNRPATAEVVKHIDRCLSCLSCMTTCPSGVNYMHLVDHARAYVNKTYKRPFADRMLRNLLANLLPYPERFRFALKSAVLVRPIAGKLFDAVPKVKRAVPSLFERMGAMLALAPAKLPSAEETVKAGVYPAEGPRRGRVALLAGCAQPVLNSSINAATIRLLTRLGVEVLLPKDEGCCGAIVLHMGREDDALQFARNNVDVWTREIESQGLDAIVINTSGCGTTIKDYGFLLREDKAYAEKAARVAGLAKDISEYLSTLDLPAATSKQMSVAYHSACSLQHGQRVTDLPKRLLTQMGFAVRDVPEGHICCGSAGTYNLLQPFFARRLRQRKVVNIERMAPDVVACGNIGCLMQIASGTKLPVVHTVELLDWATGGPKPEAMQP
ncbi:MAG: heterodisulfide reductase-related iron-sulfur binding cluster [Methylovirgula sp.]